MGRGMVIKLYRSILINDNQSIMLRGKIRSTITDLAAADLRRILAKAKHEHVMNIIGTVANNSESKFETFYLRHPILFIEGNHCEAT